MVNLSQYENLEKPEEVYIHGLPGLRTLAIFGVILYHMYPYSIRGGFLGVTLLFIISGYLLAVRSGETRKIEGFGIGHFYLKKIKRLYPQLVIVLFVTCSVLKTLLPGALEGIREEIISILLGYNNFWQIAQNGSYFSRIANTSPFTHMWSLSNEMQVFVIWPVIFYIFTSVTRRFRTKRAIDIIGLLALATALIMPIIYDPSADVTRVYYGTDTRIFSFFTGAYIGFRRVRYTRSVRIKNTFKYCILFGVLTALVLLSYLIMDGEASITYIGGMFIVNIIMAAMLSLATDNRLPIGEFLEHKVFKYFGAISYEMYLWMYPVIYVFFSMGWNRIPFSGVIMTAIIIALSKWLNSFTRLLVKGDFSMKGSIQKKLVQVAFLSVSLLFCMVTALGGYAIYKAPKRSDDDSIALRQQLEENAKILAEENASNVVSPIEDEIVEANVEPEDEETLEVPAGIAFEDRIFTAIGDSVLLGASPALLDVLPGSYIDAKESRQASKAVEILQGIKSQGNLGNTVIIELGTNGPFSESTGQEIVDFLGPDIEIFWVNVHADSVRWHQESNDTIAALAEKNENVTLIDWDEEGTKHPNWFYNDGIHLNVDGQKGYADFIKYSIMNQQ